MSNFENLRRRAEPLHPTETRLIASEVQTRSVPRLPDEHIPGRCDSYTRRQPKIENMSHPLGAESGQFAGCNSIAFGVNDTPWENTMPPASWRAASSGNEKTTWAPSQYPTRLPEPFGVSHKRSRSKPRTNKGGAVQCKGDGPDPTKNPPRGVSERTSSVPPIETPRRASIQ